MANCGFQYYKQDYNFKTFPVMKKVISLNLVICKSTRKYCFYETVS